MKADQSPEISLVDLSFKQASLEENPHGWHGNTTDKTAFHVLHPWYCHAIRGDS
jgi:hypothetical protein